MENWKFYGILAVGIAMAAAMIWSAVAAARVRRQRDFTRRLETLLQPKETICVICPGGKGRWILTSKRLILERGQRFDAFPFDKIKKVSGQDERGKATVAAGKMVRLTVKTGDRELTLCRKDESFQELVKGLKAGISAAKAKTKGGKP